MKTLSVEVRAVDTAFGLCSALGAFGAEVVEQASGEFVVKVDLSDSRTDLVAVLNALQDYVIQRRGAPAMIDLDGRAYVLDSPR